MKLVVGRCEFNHLNFSESHCKIQPARFLGRILVSDHKITQLNLKFQKIFAVQS